MKLPVVPGTRSVREAWQQSRGILQEQAFRGNLDESAVSLEMKRGLGGTGVVLDLKEEIKCYGN
jgi:hypothetical protein